MPIPFTCPRCGHQTMVADQYAGQTGPCARCGQMVTVPPVGGMPALPYPPPPRSSISTTPSSRGTARRTAGWARP